MSLNALDMIKASMRLAQVLSKGEDPDSDEANDALQTLSMMLHSWQARRLMVRATVREGFSITGGDNSYTIGVGRDFNTSKPLVITGAFIRDASNYDTNLEIITQDEYNSLEDKDISSSRPASLYYDPGIAQQATQTGTIYLYQIPDTAGSYTLYIISQKPFIEITAITDVLTFEPQYEEAIKYELAIRLWREYHKSTIPVPQDLLILANEAMHTVEVNNSVTPIACSDLPGQARSYDIYTGGYNE